MYAPDPLRKENIPLFACSLLIFLLLLNDNAPLMLHISVHDILQPSLQHPSIGPFRAFRKRDFEVSASEVNRRYCRYEELRKLVSR